MYEKPSSRVPKINPRNNNGGIIIRFQYQGKQYSLSPGGKYSDRLAIANAYRIASQIKTDILAGYFDPTLEKYQPIVQQPDNLVSINKNVALNLKELWEQYKVAKQASVAETTQKEKWSQIDRCLTKISPEMLNLENAQLLIPELLKTYSVTTLERIINDIHACSNWAFEIGLISINPWRRLKQQLPDKPQSGRTKKAYSRDEVNAIVQAFRGDWYCNIKSAFKDSWYADFVEFLFLTGCRPEDAIALTWDCVKEKVIVFDKAYCCGVLKSTKNNKARMFPITPQIRELLDRHSTYISPIPGKLIFPAQNGSYINLRNFTQRYTKRIVENLVNEGKVKQYLPTYNLRNTSITHYLRQGVDIATVAALMETSEEMINLHYWSPDDDIINNNVQLPEI
ncbi:tyrosine-type recombinase/integrase [Tolypothrix sp. FACHB-123]|uniref:tyrosine-type recombinase/integrase n=1 Tax=Tolypothrix sp. FACHB-123 TaxID=2692868 RepID=UPI001686FF3E|nr:tyrosine-type recombinase/integrase [Tolypothrix sp. FACHB-123]MBD2357381.1 tyrosine-type recombinase/integrase [Tolypothrix sp. FACHB-123]